MKDHPIQQHKPANQDNASPEKEGKGKSMTPPAFQLKASEGPAAPPPSTQGSKSGGLPADLVSGFAASTGHDLSNVNVVRNSDKPAEVGALAYAQGNDIHLGAGQEKHLAHEAAHIVQQREGRVQATTEVGGKPVNDSKSLESEADAMGDKAMQMKGADNQKTAKFSDGHDAAVSMQRMAAPIQAKSKEDFEAMVIQVHASLNAVGVDEPGVFVMLQKLQRKSGDIKKFKAAYKKQHATELVDDLRAKLVGESLVLALELMGIKDDAAVANKIDKKAPKKDTEYDAVVTRLDNALKAAAPDQEAIFAALIPFDRDSTKLTKLKTTYNTKITRKLADDLAAKLNASELAYALYLINAPSPTSSTSSMTVNGGSDLGSAKVAGGETKAQSGVKRTGQANDDMFAYKYKGGLANESRWLQFIWRDIIVTKADGSEVRLTDTITTTGGSYKLTSDPAAPSYNTDTVPGTSPFYESGGANSRTKDSTTIYDMPASADHFVQRELAAGATKVVSTAHFSTFLIRDFRPMQRYDIDVSFTYTSVAIPARVNSLKTNASATSLPAAMKARLVSQYPDYAYIE